MANVFACFEVTTEETISISVEQEDFPIFRRNVLLGFVVSAKAGSLLDPAAVKISGDGARTVYTRNDLSPLDSSSLTLARLRWGDYTMDLGGEGSTEIDFDFDAYLPGDFNGDGKVTPSDFRGIINLIRHAKGIRSTSRVRTRTSTAESAHLTGCSRSPTSAIQQTSSR